MGTVYKAQDVRLRRKVAIKFLRMGPPDADNMRQRRRFEREARAQSRIDHPNICKIYEIGEVEGQPFIAMQLIEGAPLADFHKEMTRDQKLSVIQQVCKALQAAHQQSVIHRDIKPPNVMIERAGDGSYRPYLMDFGLARESDSHSITTAGGIEGTPCYMSPEQARGDKNLDERTDIYSLGATLYDLLVGQPPFTGNTTDVLLNVILQDPPMLRQLDASIPVDVETIVHKCIEKDPARRYQSAQALSDDLGRVLVGSRIVARPPTALQRVVKLILRNKLLAATVSTALAATLLWGSLSLRERFRANEQARLAQQLAQEIKDMEWLLRAARQMPLHDLEQEKAIVRRRMQQLHTKLDGYGQLARGLAHYALGRGHMGLHEYPESLQQLQAAAQFGYQDAELHYALGYVLGKHYEMAMHQARLIGGTDWVKKQQLENERRYLQPAIESLHRSRSIQLQAPPYLEALIAYYQKKHQRALQQAEQAQKDAPWLYEASKLRGDIYLQDALSARDSGRIVEAKPLFAQAVECYQAAARIGQSDAEVYEGLAEAWVRQVEMATTNSADPEPAFAAAMTASAQLIAADPNGISGPLKKAQTAIMTMTTVGNPQSTSARLTQCISESELVLKKEPENFPARNTAASCYGYRADLLTQSGEDPQPTLRKAIALLEPTLRQFPQMDKNRITIGYLLISLGDYQAIHGAPSAKENLKQSIEYFRQAIALNDSDQGTLIGALFAMEVLSAFLAPGAEMEAAQKEAHALFEKCIKLNDKNGLCYNNYADFSASAAYRLLQVGGDPQPLLQTFRSDFAMVTKLGLASPDSEHHLALAAFTDASDRLRRRLEPTAALAETEAALGRCLELAPDDVRCRKLNAQLSLLHADWLAQQGKQLAERLKDALHKAELATQSREKHPEAFRMLAEAHLRLARDAASPADRARQIAGGLAATERLFAINSNHATGWATHGALLLLRSQQAQDAADRQADAKSAATSFTRALEHEPLLAPACAALQAEAGRLAALP